ncbi:MAG: hypothetical protein AAGI72_07175 [Pseudomonadota bacterium]
MVARMKDTLELIGLFAVVATLAALVYELRQTQDALRAQAYQARALDGTSTNFQYASNPAWRTLSAAAYEPGFDPASLSPEDRSALDHLMSITRIDLDNEHYQYQMGFLEESFYRSETEDWIRAAAPIWRRLGQIEPRADFKREVDRILTQNDEP